MVRLTDRPDMTIDVYRGRKRTTQQQQLSSPNWSVHRWTQCHYGKLQNIIMRPGGEKTSQDELFTFGIVIVSPATTIFIRLLEVQGSIQIMRCFVQIFWFPGEVLAGFHFCLFIMPPKELRWHIKIEPSVCPSVSPSVTNRVSAISHRLLKQI